MTGRRLGLLAVIALIGACAGVLGLRARPTDRPFEHRAHVKAGVSCLTCHGGVERATDDGPLHLPDAAACVTCHVEPHDSNPCLGCHTAPFAAGAASEARSHLRFAHDTHVAELKGNCMRCHSEVARADTTLRPKMAACLGCHQHQDEFVPSQCDTCHVDLQSEGTLPESHVVHDGDWLREHGVRAASDGALCATCHSQSSCASCHGVTTPTLPATLAFDRPMGSSLHRAGFASRHAEEARAQPGTCSACHDDATCRDCHEARLVSGTVDGVASPHPPGWVGLRLDDNAHGRAARRDPASCASCHGGAGEQLCVSCHQVGGVGGSVHPAGWSSNQPMSALPCRLCHQP